MKTTHFAVLVAALAALGSPGCGGSNSPAQDPTGTPPSPSADANPSADPLANAASGTSDLHSASNSSTAPLGAPEDKADPNGHAPIMSTGKGAGDTPVNSGAGDAAPETKH